MKGKVLTSRKSEAAGSFGDFGGLFLGIGQEVPLGSYSILHAPANRRLTIASLVLLAFACAPYTPFKFTHPGAAHVEGHQPITSYNIGAKVPTLAARSMCQMVDSNLEGALPLQAKRILQKGRGLWQAWIS